MGREREKENEEDKRKDGRQKHRIVQRVCAVPCGIKNDTGTVPSRQTASRGEAVKQLPQYPVDPWG